MSHLAPVYVEHLTEEFADDPEVGNRWTAARASSCHLAKMCPSDPYETFSAPIY